VLLRIARAGTTFGNIALLASIFAGTVRPPAVDLIGGTDTDVSSGSVRLGTAVRTVDATRTGTTVLLRIAPAGTTFGKIALLASIFAGTISHGDVVVAVAVVPTVRRATIGSSELFSSSKPSGMSPFSLRIWLPRSWPLEACSKENISGFLEACNNDITSSCER